MAASDAAPVTEEVKRVFDDPAAVAERLERWLESSESVTDETTPEDPVLASVREERGRILAAGVDGLNKVVEGRDTDLTPDESFGMEAIVLLEGRPAILIQDGDFLAAPREWQALESRRARIRDVIARVGRVEVDGHVDFDWVGTASLVAPNTLMTNRHVAEEFSRRGYDGAWRFKQGMASRLDFREELGATSPLEFEIIGIIGVHDEHDLALLRVDTSSADGTALPEPLTVSSGEPDDLLSRQVYVVGYPAWDGRRNEPEPMRRIFMDIFNVKRLQPGKTVAYPTPHPALQHDCSTLGGNSGSPVVDLETHEVIGLHFGGRYGVGNFAVPLWTLTDDPLLRAGEVCFA